jgi:hypothetical protein
MTEDNEKKRSIIIYEYSGELIVVGCLNALQQRGVKKGF